MRKPKEVSVIRHYYSHIWSAGIWAFIVLAGWGVVWIDLSSERVNRDITDFIDSTIKYMYYMLVVILQLWIGTKTFSLMRKIRINDITTNTNFHKARKLAHVQRVILEEIKRKRYSSKKHTSEPKKKNSRVKNPRAKMAT